MVKSALASRRWRSSLEIISGDHLWRSSPENIAGEQEWPLRQIGASLEKVVIASFRHLPPSQAALSAWPVVCGSAVAERTRAESFADGILQVTVADAAWKRELQTLAPRYVAAMNRYLGQRVDRIEFLIQSGTAWK